MTTVRRINVSQVEGDNANNTNTNELRPFGETAFYLDNNKLTLMMFDGARTHLKSKVLSPGVLYGSNADSSDGGGYDTIKLIPDADLGSDQYIVVDATQGEPGHIHLRAGGTQDASGADLYLGSELTNIRVSDTSDDVRIRTSMIGEGVQNYDWTFDINGRLTFPQGGAIESHGMGWTGLTNGTSGAPLSIAYKNAQQGNPVGLAEILLIGSTTTGNIGLYTQKYPSVSATAIYNSNGTFTTDITENDDITVVQTSWTITIDSATYLVDYVNTDVEGEFSIGVSGAVFNQGSSYTFTSPDTVGSQWSFDENGLLTLPGGGIISHQDNDLKLEVSGTDVIVLRTEGGDFVFNTNSSLSFPNDARLAPSDQDIAVIAGNNGSAYGSVGIITEKPATSYNVVQQTSPFSPDTISTNIIETPDITSIVPGMIVTGSGITQPTTVESVTGPDGFGTYTITITPSSDGMNYLETYTFTDPEAITSNVWAFNSTGAMIFPNDVQITLGGVQDMNSINITVPDSLNSETRHEWAFDASYGFPLLRFPNNTLQSTAWSGGRVVETPLSSTGAEGDKERDLAFDNDHIYYCTTDYTDGLSNIWKRLSWNGDTW